MNDTWFEKIYICNITALCDLNKSAFLYDRYTLDYNKSIFLIRGL